MATSSGTVTITRPSKEASFYLDPLVPDDREKIMFEARADYGVSEIMWYVDDVAVGIGKTPDYRFGWVPTAGRHSVRAGTGSTSVQFEVRK